MYRASWNGTVIAESAKTIEIEGNQYFPPDSVDRTLLTETPTTSVCPWKGLASYYTVTANGQSNPDAAWYYPDPKPAAAEIRDYLAFWRGVVVEKVPGD
ncbi:hypothetical protein AL755_20910 [Arthrobacter sp. ERGS1:01]|uniref:DUF427 domain-containing protein n=1 Tax=Arthrobacter sp. ERGS1:01 TaxID=1704044 RepID=UPI0006B556FF|nr:DUF427 domain-containing protein [Arthrobacter sp. ERGS1:01]ALE07369.1 hypothetical protein AL755_20910 [Arthrobacter sp. ERGS1:01]